MPPKSRKAVAKRSSPKAKKATPATPAAPSPLSAIVEERTDDTATEISPSDAIVEEAAPVAEEGVDPAASAEELKAPKLEEVEEEAAVTPAEDKIVEETAVGKIVEATTVESNKEEMVVDETVTEKLLDSVEDPMASTDNGSSIREGSGEDKGAGGEKKQVDAPVEDSANVKVLGASRVHKEVDGEENEMEVEGKDEEPEEEEEDEEEEPEEEGNEQIAEEATREGEVESISGDDEDNEEDDPAMYMQIPLTERKKQKEFELFIGGLDKGAVEEDLTKVFGVFGEIHSIRIVKHPVTKKSKGFAFIRYASIEHTKKALAELKDGTEVKGKKIRLSASQDNDTLYLGNICKTWNRDHVLETLKGYGVEQIEDMVLPDDPKSEGKIKGFAFLEFKSHSDAMQAFQRLRKPDAVFGRDVSAKVSFAQAPLHPSEEDLLKVKTVYMEGIPNSWDEAKVKDLCKQYGEIEKIQLSRNFTSSKRKDFGFVQFYSRDSAVACVEGINSINLGEDVNVKADLAKPIYKSRLAKQSRGGYKVQKDGESKEEADKSKKKKKAKSKTVDDMKETQPTLKTLGRSTTPKSQSKNSKDNKGFRTEQSGKGKQRGRKTMDTPAVANRQPSKKARREQNYGKGRGRSSTNFSNRGVTYPLSRYMPGQSAHAPPAFSYPAQTYPGASVAQHRHTDLEPHAGYLPAAKPVQSSYEYDARRADAYAHHPRSSSGYFGGSVAPGSYPGYPSYAGNQAASYPYPGSGAYAYRRPYY